MDQRDWELLDQQMREYSPPRHAGITGLTVVVVFLAGVILGGIFFPSENGLMQVARNDAKVATYLHNGSTSSTNR
jgi:hypothetical protein